MLNFPSVDCRGDGFYGMSYVLNNTCGANVKRYIRYKFVDDVTKYRFYNFSGGGREDLLDDIRNYTFYNFSRAKQECENSGARLWEVLDGEPEWDAFISLAKELKRSNLWLNAMVVGKCDELDTIEAEYSTCKHEEASEGRGLEVKWPSSHYTPMPKFSRLIRGRRSRKEDEGESCVFVDSGNHHLWDVHDCTSTKYWGLCVKRNCLWPEHQG